VAADELVGDLRRREVDHRVDLALGDQPLEQAAPGAVGREDERLEPATAQPGDAAHRRRRGDAERGDRDRRRRRRVRREAGRRGGQQRGLRERPPGEGVEPHEVDDRREDDDARPRGDARDDRCAGARDEELRELERQAGDRRVEEPGALAAGDPDDGGEALPGRERLERPARAGGHHRERARRVAALAQPPERAAAEPGDLLAGDRRRVLRLPEHADVDDARRAAVLADQALEERDLLALRVERRDDRVGAHAARSAMSLPAT
jgi:hypothetical protein